MANPKKQKTKTIKQKTPTMKPPRKKKKPNIKYILSEDNNWYNKGMRQFQSSL